MTGIKERVTSTRARADDADLAVEIGLAAQPLHRALRIADDLLIRNAALGAYFCRDIVGLPFAGAVIEVMADRRIAVMREPPGRLAVPLVPARRMMNQHDARKRAGVRRPRDIRRNGVTLVALDRNGFRNHASVSHTRSSSRCQIVVG